VGVQAINSKSVQQGRKRVSKELSRDNAFPVVSIYSVGKNKKTCHNEATGQTKYDRKIYFFKNSLFFLETARSKSTPTLIMAVVEPSGTLCGGVKSPI
jgi:hypothetical protein